MQSALSFTACATSSTSLLVIARIASRSLMSVRPISSSLVDMGRLLYGLFISTVCSCDKSGQDVGPDQATNGFLVAHVDAVGRGEGVGENQARQPLGDAGRLVGADVGRQIRSGEARDGGEHPVGLTEGDLGEDHLGLVGEDELQGVVAGQRA